VRALPAPQRRLPSPGALPPEGPAVLRCLHRARVPEARLPGPGASTGPRPGCRVRLASTAPLMAAWRHGPEHRLPGRGASTRPGLGCRALSAAPLMLPTGRRLGFRSLVGSTSPRLGCRALVLLAPWSGPSFGCRAAGALPGPEARAEAAAPLAQNGAASWRPPSSPEARAAGEPPPRPRFALLVAADALHGPEFRLPCLGGLHPARGSAATLVAVRRAADAPHGPELRLPISGPLLAWEPHRPALRPSPLGLRPGAPVARQSGPLEFAGIGTAPKSSSTAPGHGTRARGRAPAARQPKLGHGEC